VGYPEQRDQGARGQTEDVVRGDAEEGSRVSREDGRNQGGATEQRK